MYEKKIADPLRNIRDIADPFKNIRSSFQSLQKQLENANRLPKVITNYSVPQYRDQQAYIANAVTQYRDQQAHIANAVPQYRDRQAHIANAVKLPEIITNSFLVKSELAAKSIFPTFPNFKFPNVIIPRPTDNSIPPSAPEERPTPSPETDSATFIDEVNEERIPLEERRTPSPQRTPIEISQKVLIVGGCSDGTNQMVARFIEKLGFKAIILSEQPNGGRTKFGKFEAYLNVDFAITLLTPDDVGRPKDNTYDVLKPRPSQDTIFELVYLYNHLQPEQVFTLYTAEIELPSYLEGLIHVPMCSSDSWKLRLVQEMQFAGIRIDVNKLL